MSFSRMDEKEKQQALEEEQARLQALKVTDFWQVTSTLGGQSKCCSSKKHQQVRSLELPPFLIPLPWFELLSPATKSFMRQDLWAGHFLIYGPYIQYCYVDYTFFLFYSSGFYVNFVIRDE